MELFSRKLDMITVIAIVIMAISISIFDFNNFSWTTNSKSYIGLLIFFILILFRYSIFKNSKE